MVVRAPYRTALLAVIASAGLTGETFAQRRLLTPPEYVLTQWTTVDGLPQNSVTAIAQGPDGLLWLGTFGGLVRFDGTSFQVQARSVGGARVIDRVLALAVTSDSTLWVGTEDGLYRWRDGEGVAVPWSASADDAGVMFLARDARDRLWVGGLSRGLAYLDAGTWHQVLGVNGGVPGPVTGLARAPDGSVLVNVGERIFTPQLGDSARLQAFGARGPAPGMARGATRDGAAWFSVPGAALRIGASGRHRFGAADGVPEPSVLVEDAAEGVWIGSLNEGLVHLRETATGLRVQRYALPSGASRFRVRAGLLAADGSLWFGTDAGGLLRAVKQPFATFGEEQGLSSSVITAVMEDAAGTLWVGTNCHGLNAIAPDGSVQLHKPRMPNDSRGDPCVFALAEQPQGTIWAGTYGGGLSRIRDGRVEWLRYLPGLADSVVLALHATRDGALWVGTHRGGVAVLRDGRVIRSITTADGLAHNSVRQVYETRDGSIWIATLGGLSRIRGDDLQSFDVTDGLAALHVRAIHEDGDGIIWVGTYGGGLHRMTDSGFVAIGTAQGLRDDVVSSILEDEAGNFWMSGNAGIQRVSRAALLALTEGRAARVHVVLFGAEDGMGSAETNGGFQPAAWRARDGILWFPTVQGVTRVDARRQRLRTPTPRATITEVVVDGATQAATGSLSVGPGRSNLEIRYSGLSLSETEHLTYRYRLDGFDDGWVDAGTRRIAYYPRLAAGRYRFAVVAANRDGRWHETPSYLDVEVRAALLERRDVQGLALLLALGVLGAVLRGRARQSAERHAAQVAFGRQLIKSQEEERTRIARELHDGLGQELLVARNRALLALAAPDLPEAGRTQLEALSSTLGASLDSLRTLSHDLTPHQLEHLGFEPALRSMVEATAAATGLPIAYHADALPRVLAHEAALNVYRAVQEALANVVRHSQASQASVHVTVHGARLRVVVADDGCGFDVRRDADGSLLGGFGLTGIRERASLLGGSVDVVSATGRGSSVHLEIPYP